MKRPTPDQALARLHPKGKQKAKGQQQLQFIGSIGHAEEDIYLFDGPDGGVATPVDDSLPPILGVWEEGGEIPPAMKDWLQEYAAEVEWWQYIGEDLQADSPAKAKANASPRQSIAPMITTKWSQKAPYNDMCIFEGKRCATGCTATATAQVINHWKEFERGCIGTDAYITSTNGYEVDALPTIITFNYKNLVKNPKTEEEKKAVAQLMAYLGRTLHSNYTPNSTGAYLHEVADCLRDNIRLCNTAKAIFASKIGEVEFEKRIYNEIANHRPVIIGGSMASGGGHAFVIDGYDAAQDLYHINWGWGGSYNGWFAMSALSPNKSYAFNAKKDAVIGIQPNRKWGDVNGDGEVDIADAMQVVQAIQSGDNDARYDINYDGKVTITDAQVIINKIIGK